MPHARRAGAEAAGRGDATFDRSKHEAVTLRQLQAAAFDVFDVTCTMTRDLLLGLERQHHRVLLAASEERTGRAVPGNLLRQPHVRHDREVLAHEEPRVVRERATACRSPRRSRGAAARPRAARPGRRARTSRDTTSDRTSATAPRQRRQLRARRAGPADVAHDEPGRVPANLVEISRQQMSFGLMLANQRVQRLGIAGVARLILIARIAALAPRRCSSLRCRVIGSRPSSSRGSRIPTFALARGTERLLQNRHASSTSCSVTMYGGSSRITVLAVRLTSRPRSSAAGTTGVASTRSSRPAISPAPRTSATSAGCSAASAAGWSNKYVADAAHRGQQAVVELVEERQRRAAREQIAAVGRAVIAGAKSSPPLAR